MLFRSINKHGGGSNKRGEGGLASIFRGKVKQKSMFHQHVINKHRASLNREGKGVLTSKIVDKGGQQTMLHQN